MTRRIGSVAPPFAANAARVSAGAVLRPVGSNTIEASLPIKRICSEMTNRYSFITYNHRRGKVHAVDSINAAHGGLQ